MGEGRKTHKRSQFLSSTAARRKQHSGVIPVLGNSPNIHVEILNEGGLLRHTAVLTTVASTRGFVPGM